jgi:lipopolysaccharide export system protein LptA
VKKLAILFGAMVCIGTIDGLAQQKPAAAAKSSSPHPAAAKSSGSKQSSGNAKSSPGNAKQTPGATSSTDLLGGDSDKRPKGPTEITASQEAQFDTKTRIGVFIGNVKVVDPQFTLTSERLTVHLNKDEEGGGLNDAEAQGKVVIVHVNQPKTPAPAGQPTSAAPPAGAVTPSARPAASGQGQQPTTSIGKADNALYQAKDGSITLTGWPQVTQGTNTHIATAPGVKMVLYRDGRMQTYGSTRTLIEDRTSATNNPNANGPQ